MDHEEDELICDDHRAAFVFGQGNEIEPVSRPTKRRRLSRKAASAVGAKKAPHFRPDSEFVPLFDGAEKLEFVNLRQKLFDDGWSAVDARIQNVLKVSNRSTLDAVASFVREAPAQEPSKIPVALIVTGPNIASQDLLFEQLAESLSDLAHGRFVRLRSAEAPNLKATLKKIIRDVTRQGVDDGEGAELAIGKVGRKYLDYDLEALYAHIKPHDSKQVIVAFQDSEAFDTGLLSDLIKLLKSWKDRIPFTLLFGIATSVELFQTRLLKSTSQHLYGAQFDIVQMSSILESIFKAAVAHGANPLKIGPALLTSLVERQQSQVAGIQVFISSLKYAYMCHFYANPLSILLAEVEPQPEHLEALRNLPSFRAHVEEAIAAGKLKHVRALLDHDAYLLAEQRKTTLKVTAQWETKLLRSLALLMATELPTDDFIAMYTNAVADGINIQSQDSKVVDSVRKMSPDEISALLQRLIKTIRSGNRELGLGGWASEDKTLVQTLYTMAEKAGSLQAQSQVKGKPLRSQYSAQSKVLRTTVVAQKVQLSEDESKLTDEDKAFTELVNDLVVFMSTAISCQPAHSILLHELWMYESKSPHKDVFIPRPGTTFERALSRPHDYLTCVCCDKADGGNASTLPATSILYHLYQETGALVNVADLWSAFYGLVGAGDHEDDPKSKSGRIGYDERTALVLFYQGLAELNAMGFVKPTKKRADHIAKLKWLW